MYWFISFREFQKHILTTNKAKTKFMYALTISNMKHIHTLLKINDLAKNFDNGNLH